MEGQLGVLPDAGGAVGAEQEAVEVQRGDVAVEARLAKWQVNKIKKIAQKYCTLKISGVKSKVIPMLVSTYSKRIQGPVV